MNTPNQDKEDLRVLDRHSKNIELWLELSKAVTSKNWQRAQSIAEELSESFDGVKHVDGVYTIGFQLLAGAPGPARAAIENYNEALLLTKQKTRKKKRKKKGKT